MTAGWKVWAQDDELCFEFIKGKKHVIVSLERTQDHVHFGYALRRKAFDFDAGKYSLDDPAAVAAEINSYLAQSQPPGGE